MAAARSLNAGIVTGVLIRSDRTGPGYIVREGFIPAVYETVRWKMGRRKPFEHPISAGLFALSQGIPREIRPLALALGGFAPCAIGDVTGPGYRPVYDSRASLRRYLRTIGC